MGSLLRPAVPPAPPPSPPSLKALLWGALTREVLVQVGPAGQEMLWESQGRRIFKRRILTAQGCKQRESSAWTKANTPPPTPPHASILLIAGMEGTAAERLRSRPSSGYGTAQDMRGWQRMKGRRRRRRQQLGGLSGFLPVTPPPPPPPPFFLPSANFPLSALLYSGM